MLQRSRVTCLGARRKCPSCKGPQVYYDKNRQGAPRKRHLNYPRADEILSAFFTTHTDRHA